MAPRGPCAAARPRKHRIWPTRHSGPRPRGVRTGPWANFDFVVTGSGVQSPHPVRPLGKCFRVVVDLAPERGKKPVGTEIGEPRDLGGAAASRTAAPSTVSSSVANHRTQFAFGGRFCPAQPPTNITSAAPTHRFTTILLLRAAVCLQCPAALDFFDHAEEFSATVSRSPGAVMNRGNGMSGSMMPRQRSTNSSRLPETASIR